MNDRLSARISYRLVLGSLSGLVRTVYRVDVHGTEHIPASGGVIVASNHASNLDTIAIAGAILRRGHGRMGRKMTFMAKTELFEGRLGWLYRLNGQIPVERDRPAEGEPVSRAAQVLDDGGAIGLYVEGSRSPDGRLYKARTGVARLAADTGVPVVPTAITGTHAIYPKGRKMPKLHGPITVRFGEPMRYDAPSHRAFADSVMQRIAEMTGIQRVDIYSSDVSRSSAPR